MVTCARRGCGVDFDPVTPAVGEACLYHPGTPVFHEGLKSWSCCNQVNKPVMEFDQFMAIKGCSTADTHTRQKQPLPQTAKPATAASHVDSDGKEVFGASAPSSVTSVATKPATPATPANPAEPAEQVTQPLSGATLSAAQRAVANQPQEAKPEEEDPIEADAAGAVPVRTNCKRAGCDHASTGTEQRNRAQEKCVYHKGVPIFHEGSKGWSCCKPKVLDFDDFMKIAPCTTSTHGHLFVGVPAERSSEPYEKLDARVDHYETPDSVRVSVYAKGANPSHSSVTIQPESIEWDLWLPALPTNPEVPRRAQRTLHPFAPVNSTKSSFTIGKFKTEIVLVKATPGISWPALEANDSVYGYGLTFGREQDAPHNGR